MSPWTTNLDPEPAATLDLKRLSSPGAFSLVRKAGELAEKMGFGAYLVGGPVRDLLLERGSEDIDIAVEGDGLVFARRLGGVIGAGVTTYERFLTATLTLPDLTRFDVATARAEIYERPAALPSVTPAAIASDLVRRDFTVNAMAVALNPDRIGRLVDPHGGAADLRNRLLRVLHPRSFLDDPTRLVRLARFAIRFGFTIERETRAMVTGAHRGRALDALSGDRLREEVALVLEESDPARVLGKLASLGLLGMILPGVGTDRRRAKLLDQAGRLVSFVEKGAAWDSTAVKLLLLLRDTPPGVLAGTIDRLAVQGKSRAILRRAPGLGAIVRRAEKAGAPSEIHELLEDEPLEVALASLVLTRPESSRRRIVEYLRRGRGVRPDLSGDDLLEMGFAPGPGLRRILDALVRAKLDGGVSGRREARSFVLKRFRPPAGEPLA